MQDLIRLLREQPRNSEISELVAASESQSTIELDGKAKEFLAERGYDPVYGARPLKRVIQKELQNKLSEMILRGEVVDGAKIDVSVKKDALSFNVKEVNNKDAKSVA